MKRLLLVVLAAMAGCGGEEALFDLMTINNGPQGGAFVEQAWECDWDDGDNIFRIGFYGSESNVAGLISTDNSYDSIKSIGIDSLCATFYLGNGLYGACGAYLINISGSTDEGQLFFTTDGFFIAEDGDYTCGLVSCNPGECFL